MKIEAPALPLTPKTFALALRKEHGWAMHHTMLFGGEGLKEHLLQHSLQCFVYDSQAEESRAPWVAKTVHAAGLGKEKFCKPLLLLMQRTILIIYCTVAQCSKN